MFLIVILLVLSCLILLQYFWNNKKFFALAWQLPGPFAWPIFGNAFEFFCKDEDIFDRAVHLVNSYPSPMRVWFGPKLSIVFSEANQAEKILSSLKFANKDEVYRFMKPFIGDGLISGSGPKWKRDRRLLSPLFLKKNINTYFQSIVNHAKILTNTLEKNEMNQATFNIRPYLHNTTIDFVNESMIGIQLNQQIGNHLSVIYEIVYARIVKVWLQLDCVFRFTHYWRKQEDAKKSIHAFMENALDLGKKRHVHMGLSTDTSSRSFLDQMLDIRDEVDYATDQEFVEHLTTLYAASEDTIQQICSYTLVLLGMYPEIQQKVANEIERQIGQSENFSIEDLDKLQYLDMCIKEVLRLYAIAPFIMRVASQDFEIEKWTIPEGCSVMVSIHNIHRSPTYWEKPNSFYPEHFLPDTVKKRHPYAFLPFSAGPRGCSGKSYAYLAMKIVLVKILQKFLIEADGQIEEKQLKADISVRFKDDNYPIRIRRRV